MNKLKVFTSFSGIGSQEIALRDLGIDFEMVGISEVDRYGLLCYDAIHNDNEEILYPSKEDMIKEFKEKNIAYNFSTNKIEIPSNINDIKKLYKAHIKSKNYGDIRKINPNCIPDFDLFTYSFPCKDISIVGKCKGFEKGSDTRSALLWECEKIISIKKPKYLLMENVKNIISDVFLPFLEDWMSILEKHGYKNYYKCLNTEDFGLPQNRERVFMISILDTGDNQVYSFPHGQYLTKRLFELTENNKDELYFEKDLERSTSIFSESSFHIKNISKRISKTMCDKIIKYKEDIEFSNKEVFYIPCTSGWSRHRLFLTKSGTILASGVNGMIFDKTNVIRYLYPIEVWRLQGYSDEDYYKCEKLVNSQKLYERAGRGISIPVLKGLFKNLLIDKKYKNVIEF